MDLNENIETPEKIFAIVAKSYITVGGDAQYELDVQNGLFQ